MSSEPVSWVIGVIETDTLKHFSLKLPQRHESQSCLQTTRKPLLPKLCRKYFDSFTVVHDERNEHFRMILLAADSPGPRTLGTLSPTVSYCPAFKHSRATCAFRNRLKAGEGLFFPRLRHSMSRAAPGIFHAIDLEPEQGFLPRTAKLMTKKCSRSAVV